MAVYERKRDGTWFYRFQENNETYQKYGFPSWGEANKAERKQVRDIEDGKKAVTGDLKFLTFPQAAEIFYNEYAHALDHERDYRLRFPKIVAYAPFQKRLFDITKDDIKALLFYLQETEKTTEWVKGQIVEVPISDRTINHYHAHVKAVFEWWIKEKDLNLLNPAKKVKMLDIPEKKVRFLYPAEEAILTPVVKAHTKMWPYYFTALETGLRVANLCHMRVKDVDFTLGHIFIHGNLSKNGNSGYIPISDRLESWLKTWVKGKGQDDRVLGTYIPTSVSQYFTKLTREAGIDDFSFHDLRHTFATYHLLRGESMEHVSKLLLHKDVRVTQKHYDGVLARHLKKVVDGGNGIVKFGDGFGGGSQEERHDAANVVFAGSSPARPSNSSPVSPKLRQRPGSDLAKKGLYEQDRCASVLSRYGAIRVVGCPILPLGGKNSPPGGGNV